MPPVNYEGAIAKAEELASENIETLVFGPEFSAGFHGHFGFVGHVDHDLIQALGMHVDLDDTSRSGDCLEERLPEGIAALGDTALAMDTQSKSANLWAGF